MEAQGAHASAWRRWSIGLWRALPRGDSLSLAAWRKRHRIVLGILAAHIPFLWWLGVYGGNQVQFLGTAWRSHDLLHATAEVAALGLLVLVAAVPWFGRRVRSITAAVALVASGALLTHFSGGYIEAHFHFFVILGIVALYRDWLPFSLTAVFVALHHLVMGALVPSAIYNHPAAINYPFAWALVHAGFILGLAAVLITQTQLELKAEREREAATNEVRRERERLRMVLDNTGAIVFTTDAESRFTMLEGRDLGGVAFTARELVGRSADEVFGREHPEIPRNLRRALRGESFSADITFRGRVFHTMYRPRWDPETGMVVGVLACSIDMTERVRAEKAERLAMLQRANIEHLKATERFRRQLFNTAAHELNTPLTPIQIQLHMLRSGELGEVNQEQERALEMLERNMTRLGTLVKDVLDVARIQNARLEVHPRPVDLGDLAEDAVDSFEATARRRGIRLIAETEPGIIVPADERRILQVIYNFLSNAVKFTPEGGQVVVSTRRIHDKVQLTVQDTGLGMRPEDVASLFQPFSQVHDKRERPDGSGLGLYIARGIVERHGGRIWAESPGPGKGSLFAFELPIAPVPRAGTAISSSPPKVRREGAEETAAGPLIATK